MPPTGRATLPPPLNYFAPGVAPECQRNPSQRRPKGIRRVRHLKSANRRARSKSLHLVLDGRQPLTLKFENLCKHTPLSWVEQRRRFGFRKIRCPGESLLQQRD